MKPSQPPGYHTQPVPIQLVPVSPAAVQPAPAAVQPAPAAVQPAPAGVAGTWQAWLVIAGIGVDLTNGSRPEAALQRTSALAARLFTTSELGLPSASLADCLTAKTAVAKAAVAKAAVAKAAGVRWSGGEAKVTAQR